MQLELNQNGWIFFLPVRGMVKDYDDMFDEIDVTPYFGSPGSAKSVQNTSSMNQWQPPESSSFYVVWP